MPRGVETRRDRARLARDAGFRRLSVPSVVTGTMAAFGTFVVLSGVVAAVADWVDADDDYLERDWAAMADGPAIATVAVMALAFLLGGYGAGRMARRSGLIHGVATAALGVVVGGLSVLFADSVTDGSRSVLQLRDLGIPGTEDEWRAVDSLVGIGSLVVAFLGAAVGGLVGERWHARLLARAIDPEVGPEAEARQAAAREAAAADQAHRAAEDRAARATASEVPLEETRATREADIDLAREPETERSGAAAPSRDDRAPL